ncbi:MAG: hypothetical protein DRP74_06595, partial [Candidatus Omnitrophota bacterium]
MFYTSGQLISLLILLEEDKNKELTKKLKDIIMILRRIKLQNFKSFKLVDVPLKQRLVFITGINQDFNTTNYVGKSSLLDGIMYGLFGRSKVQPKYLVRLGTKQMSVELDLLVNNSEIHISRTRN